MTGDAKGDVAREFGGAHDGPLCEAEAKPCLTALIALP
jgi:hypothetical protein